MVLFVQQSYHLIFLCLNITTCTLRQSTLYLSSWGAWSNLLWWLILCGHLTDSEMDDQIAGQILFLGVSVRGFLEEINIWISRLSKENHLINSSGHYTICWRPEQDKKVAEGLVHSLLSWDTISFCPPTSALLVLGPWDSDQDWPLAPLVHRPLGSD